MVIFDFELQFHFAVTLLSHQVSVSHQASNFAQLFFFHLVSLSFIYFHLVSGFEVIIDEWN